MENEQRRLFGNGYTEGFLVWQLGI